MLPMMKNFEWIQAMNAAVDTALFFDDFDVIDIKFVDGSSMEVYVAVSPAQRARGLASISSIDLDGMLFFYQTPTYVPFTAKKMLMDIDVAWYTEDGKLIQKITAKAGQGAMYCPEAFSYVLEAPLGLIPDSSLLVRASNES